MEEIEAVAEAKGLLSRPIFSENIDLAASVIKAGGVVICPAEGVYGLSCNALNEEAVKRIIAIKERDGAKGLITLAASMEDLGEVIDTKAMSTDTLALMSRLWPGPYTSANLSGADAVSEFSLLSPIILRRVDLALTLPCGGLEGSTSVYDTLSRTLLRKGPLWPKDVI